MKSKRIILMVALLLIASVTVYFAFIKNSGDNYGYKNKAKFPDKPLYCDALIISCGYCPGEVIEGYCYYNSLYPE